ncbi:hypothetical protein [Streptomyces hydrogenans]
MERLILSELGASIHTDLIGPCNSYFHQRLRPQRSPLEAAVKLR